MKSRRLILASVVAAMAALTVPSFARADDNNVLKIANGSENNNLDPHTVQDLARLPIKINVYDPLFRWRESPPQLVPWLAKDYAVSGNGTVYTVNLVKDVKFHDGSPLTAADVVYSMERILALKQGPARFFMPLIAPGNTKALDPYTVQFTLKGPAAPFAGLLAELYVVNQKLVQAHAKNDDWGSQWLSSHEAGSGPFQLTEYDPATGWYAQRFKDYFKGWGPNPIDGIRFRTIRETNSQVLALMRGDEDIILSTMPYDQVQRLRHSFNLAMVRAPSQRLFLINMNNQKKPFDDIHIRRAFAYAFDYDGFITNMLGGMVRRNPTPMPPTVWGDPKDVEGFSYDLTKAKAELAEASEKITGPVTISVMSGFPQPEEAAEVLQAGLHKIGIQANIVTETWPTLSAKCASLSTAPDIMPIWASANYGDPASWTGEMYDSARWGSYATCSFYKNPKVDALLHAAFVEQDHAKREQEYEEATRLVIADSPSLFIYNEDFVNVMNKRVHGFSFCPIGQGDFLYGVSLK